MGRDLPVTVELTGRLAQEVTAYVEGEAGWQVVTVGGPPRPVLALTDRPRAGPPCVVIVDGMPTTEQTRAALLDGATDVIGWPHDRARLLDAPLRAHAPPGGGPGPPVLRIGGAAGGTGTSTVALAMGGLLAWHGRRALVVGASDLLELCGLAPWTGPGVGEVMALHPADAATEVAALARPVRGVDGLRVLAGSGAAVRTVAAWPADVVVADVGVAAKAVGTPVDVVVARPDGCLRRVDPAAAVVVVGDGPLDRRGIRRLLGRAPTVWLPTSHRVARAGVGATVPAALPGSWLAALRGLFTHLPPAGSPQAVGKAAR